MRSLGISYQKVLAAPMGLKDLLEGEVVKIAAMALVGIIGVGAISLVLPWFVFTVPLWIVLVAGYWYFQE